MSQSPPPTTYGPPLFSQVPVQPTVPPVGPEPITIAAPPGQEVPQTDTTGADPFLVNVAVPVPGGPVSDIGQYGEWAVTTHYYEDTGLRGSAVCGAFPARMDVVRVHGGETYKVVSFRIRREISPPEAPSVKTNSSNEILIGRRISPVTVGDLPDGNVIWTLMGQYTYLCLLPPSEADVLRFGVSPINGIPASAGDLPPSAWNQNLNPPSPASGSLSGWPTFPF